jgi:hypothetical protein
MEKIPMHISDAMIAALEKLVLQHETGVHLLFSEDYTTLRNLLITLQRMKKLKEEK